MRAAVYHGPHQDLTFETLDVDAPADHEVLVRTVASGVCHSDLHFVDGALEWPTPAVLGHEGAGVVEAVGSRVTYVEPGDHVIVTGLLFCGHCEECLAGFPSRCLTRPRRRRDEPPRLSWQGKPVAQLINVSSFAERMLTHENAVVKVRKDMPLDRAALIGCGVSTGVGAVFNAARVQPGSTVAVFGTGGVGLSAIQGARLAGARTIIAVDIVAAKLDTARALGATHAVDASREEPVAAVKALSGGGVDYAFEAIGLPQTAQQALLVTRPGGTATIIGSFGKGVELSFEARFLTGDRKLQGVTMGQTRSRIDMPRYVDFYMQGQLLLDEMISRRGPLTDVNEMLRALRAGEVARTILMFD